MKKKLVFLEDLMASDFGIKLMATYTIVEVLSITNLSEIVLLEAIEDQHPMVLKVISTQFGCTVDVDHLSQLNHPNLATVNAYGITKAYIYLLKPYYEGPTLDTFTQQYGPFSKRALQDIIIQIAGAVAYLHQQKPKLILRDLKPSNVIMHQNHLPIIIDLESSRAYSEKSQDTVILGTPGYASPEHYGIKETDERSDVYLLGMLLHYMITQEVWVQRKTVHPRLLGEHTDSLRTVIEKAIAFDPDSRYQTVPSFIEAIEGSSQTQEKKTSLKWQPIALSTSVLTIILLVYALLTLNQNYQGTRQGDDQAVTPIPETQAQTTYVMPSDTGDVVIYAKGNRTEYTSQVTPESEPRELPLGLYQTPKGADFATYLNKSQLPKEIADVDNIGVGGGAYSIEDHYQEIMREQNEGIEYFSIYGPPGSDIIEFLSVGDYYYGNHIVLYAGKEARAVVVVGIDNSVAYKIFK